MKTLYIEGDELALRIMLSGAPPAEVKSRLEKAAKLFGGTLPCPECGDEGQKENNSMDGVSGDTWLCTKCGHQFDNEFDVGG